MSASTASGVLETFPLEARAFLLERLPTPWGWLAASLLSIGAIVVVFASIFAISTLLERKILARIQNRPGPNRVGPGGLLQPLADAIKTITKEDIVPRSADGLLHFLAPVVLVAGALLSFAVIPFGRHLVPVELEAGVLFFFAAAASSEVAVFMAGWASRNKYAMLAAMRALAQLISYELPLVLAVVPVVMLAGSLSTVEIVAAQAGWWGGILPQWHVFSPWGLGAFLVFMIAALAESNRSPFDLPEAESELIAGHLTEYSGFKYALFFMAEYLGMTALCCLAVTLFLGGWHAPSAFLEFVPSYLWFGAKLGVLIVVLMWIRGTVPRLRIDQLMRLSWKFLVPVALGTIVNAAFWHSSAEWGGAWPAVRWAAGVALLLGPPAWLARRLSAGLGPRVYRYAT
ncbi:NADH-quinone oxidoreductase subunit NuoH [Opitutales bacterium ASA1]|uniref:NADH-quinone oxidoreductase subunit NuoH n=1 Tax=Congregicoccus parvus TaxID=3081749 RepID=UPI002B283322|nr:NADH-quinone oxidoreductase subunit NuoH [Opitutales bacterium ASA1]